MRRNTFRRANDKGQLGVARCFARTDFRRLADILPKAFKGALCMPKLRYNHLFTQMQACQRHKIIIEKNITRTG